MLTLIRAVSSHIFKKAIHSHDVGVITRSYSALNMTLNEAFNNSLQNDHKISKLLFHPINLILIIRILKKIQS
ncbi:MAG: hypothetical protein LN590_02705 [Rickettsia endosymbiont of Glossina mortisans submortisans]|nr:hypothetical protein [Rickettsia endosymbiont of Glossina mortisans submortisans]